MQANGETAEKNSKKGYHIRGNFGGKEQAQEKIKKGMSSLGFKDKDYSLEYIQPGDFENGSKSGSFPTYKVTAKKDKGEIEKGNEVFIASSVKESGTGEVKSSITYKSLTPTGLGISGEYTSIDDMVNAINSSVKTKQPKLHSVLSSLMNDVVSNTPKIKGGLKNITTNKNTIPYSEKTKKFLKDVSKSDLATIGKDFGELLGGIYLGTAVGIKNKLNFPKGNEKLVDFYIDGYKISSKYDKGAAASMTDLIKSLDPSQIKKGSEEEKFYNSVKVFTEKGVTGPNAFLNLAKNEQKKMPAIKKLANIIGVKVQDLNTQVINDYVTNLVSKLKGDDKKNAALNKTFGDLYSEMGRAPKGNKVEWSGLDPKLYYGVVTAPFSYYVKDRLNEIPEYKEMLKDMVSKTEVKQMYLLFSTKENGLVFNIKSFNDPNAQFEFEIPSISVNNPTSSKLGFKLK
jgi:hypothetical protein